ncbi:MAG TPA: DUF6448 family protein [bacterium]|nr:DUF6448 family protein [bacterium]
MNARTKIALGLALAVLAVPAASRAHCDSLDGPVVIDARKALTDGIVDPVLKWVAPEDESAIRESFDQTRRVRSLGPEAMALADRHFFETLVRIHRQSEGAPFTGLKPEGSAEPGIAMADIAVETGSVDELVGAVTNHAGAGIRERFERLQDARRHADDSVPAGREFVEAYVEFIHYVRGIHQAAAAAGHAAGEAPPHN